MKYNLNPNSVPSYRFLNLLYGLMLDDKTPFGYVIMVRKYSGEFSKGNKDLHQRYMRDKVKFQLPLDESDISNNIERFRNIAKSFTKEGNNNG